MTHLIATSVIRGSQQGESHGGVFLIRTDDAQILQPLDWNTMDIDWRSRGWDRGLRGIAIHDDKIYIAASDELFIFNERFEPLGRFHNPYLKHCHEICIYRDHLFLTATAFDSILAFNLKTVLFDWALHVRTDGNRFTPVRFDPKGEDGPLMINKLHLNSVHCDDGGLYLSGLKTKALLTYTGTALGVLSTLPEGTHNARPHKDGVLFNDTRADAVRFAAPGQDTAFRVPRFAPHKLLNTKLDDSRIARQGFGRGLCVIDDALIATGSSPSTICLHNLDSQKTEIVINLTMDVRNAIHGLEVWPFAWPDVASLAKT